MIYATQRAEILKVGGALKLDMATFVMVRIIW